MTPMRIFIGFDSREPIAFHVLSHSLMRRATRPIAIYPLCLAHLRGAYWRARGPQESTEFSMTRFLVPYLSGFDGWSLFMDSDMLCQADIGNLLAFRDDSKAVLCCQHDYTPKSGTKFQGHQQTVYPRKNWSSLMLFNNARCEALTPEYVNTATPMMLHRFQWTEDDRVGSLPLDWNWLVGEYGPNAHAKNLHYTLGGPWFPETVGCDHADLWRAEHALMCSSHIPVAV
jgi:hypothetical protein